MRAFDTVSKLNTFIKNAPFIKKNDIKKVSFLSGNLTEQICKTAKENFPYGKVAVLYFKSSYEVYGKTLSKMLKANFNSITHVVLPDTFKDSVEEYSNLFNLAEDIRLVVTVDDRLYNVAKYFASVRQITCFLGVTKINTYNIFSSVNLTNGKENEVFIPTCPLFIGLDPYMFDISSGEDSDVYAFVVSHALALVDYRIHTMLKGLAVDKSAYTTVSNAVTKTYPLFNYYKEQRRALLVEKSILIQLANAFGDKLIYQSFSSRLACEYCSKSISGDKILSFSLTIAKIYQLLFSSKYDNLLEYPTYLKRADYIRKNSNYQLDYLLKELIDQSKLIKKDKSLVIKLKNKLLKDVNSFIKCSSKILNIFTALGGQTLSQDDAFVNAVKHSGDLILNGMSLVRESGISEYL